MRAKARPETGQPAARAARTGREKVSVTIDREILDEIRQRAENLSEYVNQALSDDLYFERLREESARLEAEGIEVDEKAVERLTQWMLEAKRRIRARRAAQRKATGA